LLQFNAPVLLHRWAWGSVLAVEVRTERKRAAIMVSVPTVESEFSRSVISVSFCTRPRDAGVCIVVVVKNKDCRGEIVAPVSVGQRRCGIQIRSLIDIPRTLRVIARYRKVDPYCFQCPRSS